ncbi:MAG: competence/damage-inducible protein A, partial [Pseudomonadota bacterium]
EIAGPLGELQAQYPDIDLGSYPFYRQDRYGTSLVMRGTDESRLEALSQALRQLITAANGEIIEGELA